MLNFIKFLKDNNAYGQYLINFYKGESFRKTYCPAGYHTIKYFFSLNRERYIVYAFNFATTCEGSNYWENLSNKWRRMKY